MKKELKEKATKCKDFVKEHAVGIGVGTLCVVASVIGVTLFKNKNSNKVILDKSGDTLIEWSKWKPNHCVELEETTLKNALESIEETFKDVDKDTKVFALIYDNV